MKILVIGLDGAVPELLLEDERLGALRQLMEFGCYGRLETVTPPITVPAWMCLSTSRDPGELGVYGFRNRTDHSYDSLGLVDSSRIQAPAIWDQVALEGKRAHIIGVPPNYPPRRTSGVSVGCFLTPDTTRSVYTEPADVGREIAELVGEYPTDVRGFRTDRKQWLKDEIYAASRKQFDVLRHFVGRGDWDYLQFVEIGLDRIQHGFWKHHDPDHRAHEAGSPYATVVRDYYAHLDEQVARVLELLDDETVVLVTSDHGAKRLDGGFCVNEWLVREGLLSLDAYPDRVANLAELDVNWRRTTAWSEGGYYARVFLNVKGREPHGTVEPDAYEQVRDDLKARLEATVDEQGEPPGTVVFKPEELYRDVNNIAPDLIVHFGDLYWRSIGGVGYPTIHVHENDTGPDDCNHAQYGAFILASPCGPTLGEVHDVHLLDLAPTLLEMAGYDVPPSMRESGLVGRQQDAPAPESAYSAADEAIVAARLQGLGYI